VVDGQRPWASTGSLPGTPALLGDPLAWAYLFEVKLS
jgi:hypothetical protein